MTKMTEEEMLEFRIKAAGYAQEYATKFFKGAKAGDVVSQEFSAATLGALVAGMTMLKTYVEAPEAIGMVLETFSEIFGGQFITEEVKVPQKAEVLH